MSMPDALACFSAGAPDSGLAETGPGPGPERAPEAPARASAATTTATPLRPTSVGPRTVAAGPVKLPRERGPRRNAHLMRSQSCRISLPFLRRQSGEEKEGLRLLYTRAHAEAGIVYRSNARSNAGTPLHTPLRKRNQSQNVA